MSNGNRSEDDRSRPPDWLDEALRRLGRAVLREDEVPERLRRIVRRAAPPSEHENGASGGAGTGQREPDA